MENFIFLKLAIDNSHSGFAYCEIEYDQKGNAVDYNLLYVNSTIKGFYESKNLELKQIKQCINIDINTMNLYKEALSNENPWSAKQYFKTVNRWFNISFSWEDKDYFVMELQDITNMELEKEKSNSLKDSMKDSIYELDENYDFIDVFINNEDRLKIPRRELINRNINDVIHPITANIYIEAFKKAYESKEKVSFVYKDPRENDKRWFYTEVVNRTNSFGKHRYFATVRDITAQKEVEFQLKENKEKFYELFKALNSAVAFFKVLNNGEKAEDYIISDVNEACENLEKRSKDEMIGKNILQVSPGLESLDFVSVLNKVWKTGKSEYLPPKFYTDDHFNNWYERNLFKIPSGEIVSIYNDVTNFIVNLEKLNKRLEYEKLINSIASTAVNVSDIDDFQDQCLNMMGKVLDVSRIYIFERDNKKGININRYEWAKENEHSLKTHLQFVKDDEISWILKKLMCNENVRVRNIDEIPDLDAKYRYKKQSIKSMLLVPLFIDGSYYGFMGFDKCDDYKEWIDEDVRLLQSIANIITQTISRKKAEKLLLEEHAQLLSLFDSIEDVIFVSDMDNHELLFCNKAMIRQYGDDILGKNCYEVLHDEVAPCSFCNNHSIRNSNEPYIWENYNPNTNRYHKITNRVISWPDGRNVRFEIDYDITELKRKEKEISYLSYHDSLTGLHNRAYFEKEIKNLDNEKQLPLGLIIGDVNGLKMTNDVFGHVEGDKLLKVIANILKSCCRKDDIIARWGGDEFVILIPRASEELLTKICRRIKSTCKSYKNLLSDDMAYPSISLGWSIKKHVEEDVIKLIKIAEDYMYKYKLLESRSLHSSIIASMKKTLYEKSNETEEHASRLRELCLKVGLRLGLTDNELNELELFAMLHDIGKIAIDDHVLMKAGPLTEEEWIEIKKHPEIGYRIAQSAPELAHVAEYILSHHERYDGKGYPQGLKAEEIPLLSRILTIVDTYDAMTQDRVYRKALTEDEAKVELLQNAGIQFDPLLVKVFLEELNSNI